MFRRVFLFAMLALTFITVPHAFADPFAQPVFRVFELIQRDYLIPNRGPAVLVAGLRETYEKAGRQPTPATEQNLRQLENPEQAALMTPERIREICTAVWMESGSEPQSRDVCLESMVAALADPYSKYMNPEAFDQHKRELDGDFERLGFAFDPQHNVVINLLPGGPAELAGLRVGDQVIEIDGKPALEEMVKLDFLHPDQEVRFTIKRGEMVREIIVVSKSLHIDPVVGLQRVGKSWDYTIPNKFPNQPPLIYIRLREFVPGVAEKISAVLKQERRNGMLGVVLDFRGNRGGSITEAKALAELFLAMDSVIYDRKDRKGSEKSTAIGGRFRGLPLTILVDDDTASASELVAAALQDHESAKIIGSGEGTRGKGCTQNIYRLKEGGALRLTVSIFTRPNGEPIEKLLPGFDPKKGGVKPSPGFDVALPQDIHDAIRKYREQIDHGEQPVSPPDPQLDRAVEFLQMSIQHGG
jgi:carboxyl-terminal processing protease